MPFHDRRPRPAGHHPNDGFGNRSSSTFVEGRSDGCGGGFHVLSDDRALPRLDTGSIKSSSGSAQMIPDQQIQTRSAAIDGTLDGTGAGDHDQPYRFGRKPTVSQPFPFSTHEFARMLILRGRVQAGASHC